MNANDERLIRLVILNSHIWTGNPAQPYAEAMVVSSDKIIDIGNTTAIKKYAQSAQLILDETDNYIYPGFIDSHCHFIEGGHRLSSVQLRDARTPEEFIQRITTYAQKVKPGEWIIGGDWDHQQWGGQLPQRDWIDAVTLQNPVWLNRLDGHMNLANQLTLEIAGISASTPDVVGGKIVKDASGEPTGILQDNAMNMVLSKVPPYTIEQDLQALQKAMAYVARYGVTSVQHMGTWQELKRMEFAKQHNLLKTRIHAAVPSENWQQLADKINSEGNGDSWLSFSTVKMFIDGSLGSHTAAFFEPYIDIPKDYGLLIGDLKEQAQMLQSAVQAGLQPAVHAIGDRAVHEILNIFEKIRFPNQKRRFRIEHAQHLNPNDIPRFKQLAVIASMQPYHLIDDGCWAASLLDSKRLKYMHAYRALLDAGVRVIFGSDWYVAPPDPIFGIYAAVTRATLDGKNPKGWYPEQKISINDALRAYTVWAAAATGENDVKGTIEVGKLADIVILNQPIEKISPAEIKDVQVKYTILGGEIIYQHKK